jgi:uncharacterized protein YicC (UPF0701 family)
MMPTTKEVLASMQLALKEHVEPKIEDKWAQSALRSIDALLNHLQARVPTEGPVLHEDTTDLVQVLREAEADLASGVPVVQTFLSRAPGILDRYASVEELQALNHEGREAVDQLLRHCRRQGARSDEAEVLPRLRAYLLRHADRESAYFFPVFVGRPV